MIFALFSTNICISPPFGRYVSFTFQCLWMVMLYHFPIIHILISKAVYKINTIKSPQGPKGWKWNCIRLIKQEEVKLIFVTLSSNIAAAASRGECLESDASQYFGQKWKCWNSIGESSNNATLSQNQSIIISVMQHHQLSMHVLKFNSLVSLRPSFGSLILVHVGPE